MKKIVSLCLAVVMMAAVALPSHGFSDIADPMQQVAAEGLSSIGVISAGDSFYPQNFLKRSEFCKMAVLAGGFNEMSTYSSYTLYPDVRNGSWFAPYVNAAVKKYKIINGYPSGNFGPEDDITYGQAVTILLRMLGYKDEEVGAFWPRDFMLKANEIGLSKGVPSLSGEAAIPRGYAAIMINNMLLMNTKEGAPFVSTGFAGKPDSILLATSKTDSVLKDGQVKIMNGDKTDIYEAPYMPQSLTGFFGTAVFDKQNPGKLVGFLSDTSNATMATVKSTDVDGITTQSGKVYVPKTAKVSVMGYVAEYATSWFDIKGESKVMIYRDSRGAITSLAVLNVNSVDATVLYGVDGAELVKNATFTHKGASITKDKLKKYDVLSYSAAANQYTVSDNTLILRYESSGPTYDAPTYIVAGGQRFNINDRASKYFKDVKFGQSVTLLLDNYGNVQGAFQNLGTSTMSPRGILKSLSDSACEIKFDNGYTIKGTPDFSQHNTSNVGGQQVSNLYGSLGRFVTAYQAANGKMVIRPMELSRSVSLGGSTLDLNSDKVAANVKIYEQMGIDFPVYLVEDSSVTSLKTAGIKHVSTDRNGKIDLIVTDDITGDHYLYGMIRQSQDEVPSGSDFDGSTIMRTQYTLTVENAAGKKTFTTYYNPGMGFGSVPAAIAKDAFGEGKYVTAPVKALKNIGTATRDSFDSIRGVRINGVYVPIHDDVQVYISAENRYISLSEARANFELFTLYGEEKVTFITTAK